MKRLNHVSATSRVSASTINALIDAINEIAMVSVGPGLLMRRTAGGTNIALQFPRGATAAGSGEGPPCAGGELITLDQTQATQDADDWDRTDDDAPVSVDVVTDIEYDTTTHKLAFRTRTLTFNRCGYLIAVSGESELVEITEAEEC